MSGANSDEVVSRSCARTARALKMISSASASQLVRFRGKRRVYEHFGQKAVTQRICAGARFSRPRARTGAPHRIAAICLSDAMEQPRRIHAEFGTSSTCSTSTTGFCPSEEIARYSLKLRVMVSRLASAAATKRCNMANSSRLST